MHQQTPTQLSYVLLFSRSIINSIFLDEEVKRKTGDLKKKLYDYKTNQQKNISQKTKILVI